MFLVEELIFIVKFLFDTGMSKVRFELLFSTGDASLGGDAGFFIFN